jgi:hypothetical protein
MNWNTKNVLVISIASMVGICLIGIISYDKLKKISNFEKNNDNDIEMYSRSNKLISPILVEVSDDENDNNDAEYTHLGGKSRRIKKKQKTQTKRK